MEKVAFLPIADLRLVNYFFRWFAKNEFRQKADKKVLMDWKGRFSKAYGFKKNSCNILVFAPDGKLVIQKHCQEEDPKVLNEILAAIRNLLGVHPQTLGAS